MRKKRVYRRPKRFTRRPRAQVLDITSVKKRDNMSPGIWNGTNWTPSAFVITPTGGEITALLWAASFRKNQPAPNKQTRTAKEIFLKGFRDDVQIETGSGMAWEWRRIVFSVKTLARHSDAPLYVAYDPAYGYMRALRHVAPGAYRTALESILFAGSDPHDWLTPMAAKVDVNAVTLHSDKVMNIRSGNNGGIIGKYKHYHPINKRMVYADSEDGGQTIWENFTTDSKEGLGDVYILDYLRPTVFAVDSDQLLFRPNATMYWHER